MTTPRRLLAYAMIGAALICVLYSWSCTLILPRLDGHGIDAGVSADSDISRDVIAPPDGASDAADADIDIDEEASGHDADLVADTDVLAEADVDIDEALARVDEGLEAIYRFDEGAGTTIYDVSGNEPPIDLTIDDDTAVNWIASGLEMNTESLTIAHSLDPPTRLIDACQASNALTVEAWIVPAFLSDDGPGRIVTLSMSGENRNFSLAQGSRDDRELWSFRLRTDDGETQGDNNGLPQLETRQGITSLDLTHLVFTHSELTGMVRLYVDGNEVEITQFEDRVTYTQGWPRSGGYSNWDMNSELALGWELDTTGSSRRAWVGTYRLVAIFCRVLTATEVEQNFLVGP